MNPIQPSIRNLPLPSDRDAVARIVANTGFFRQDEIDIAVELIEERLAKPDTSSYQFLFAECDGEVSGYVCYGEIPCALGSYDLYWIAVDSAMQGRGVGRRLLEAAEQSVREQGGRHLYIETSGRPQYLPTRAFYERCGYSIIAVLPEFYDRGDDKVIWRSVLLES